MPTQLLATLALFSPALAVVASSLDGASLSLNATKVSTGDWVRVTWSDLVSPADLAKLKTYKTVWKDDECSIVGSGDGSLWLGQFTPPVASLADVRMTGDPKAGGPTEGTPPYTTPAPVKFISGGQLANGYYDFKLTNMRAETNFVLFEGSLTDASSFKPLALSANLTFADRDMPTHGRLARTSSTDEMRVRVRLHHTRFVVFRGVCGGLGLPPFTPPSI
jgi:hypothetical protein